MKWEVSQDYSDFYSVINYTGHPNPSGSLSPLIEGAPETSYNEEAGQLKDMLAMSISMREKVEAEKMVERQLIYCVFII